MKRLFLVCILGFSSCFALSLKVTKIIPEHNIYIFERQYMIQTSGHLEGVKVGRYLDIDTNLFYNTDSWVQWVPVTKSYIAGTTYDDIYDAYGNYLYTDSHVEYGYETYDNEYYFYPLGLVGRKSIKLTDFSLLAMNQEVFQPLSVYTTVFQDHGWLEDKTSMKVTNFPTTPIVGAEEGIEWLVAELSAYEEGYTHKIYPIYDRNFPDLLAGVLHRSKKRKVFLFDHMDGLALFARQ